MNSLPTNDPLIALWQTAPKPDTQHLLQDLQHLKGQHRRLNRSVLAILCGFSLLLIFEEATGRIGWHGVLSAVWILCVGGSIAWQRRARCNRFDALTLDTVSLLKFMIRRAKSDLGLARRLYLGVPLGAAVGGVVAMLAGMKGSAAERLAHPHLHWAQTAAGVAALVIMTATGAILAPSRRRKVQELTEKLKLMENDL